MKKCLIIFAILLIAGSAFGADYYVATGGDNGATGLVGFPWETVAKVNTVDFANGDTISFNQGNTWQEQLTLNGITSPSGKTVTIDAYGSGAAPWIKGGAKDSGTPIVKIDNTGLDLIIQNMDFSGQEWTNGGYKGSVQLDNLADITIDNVTWDGTYVDSRSDWATALEIDNPSGTVEVKNCTIKNYGHSDNWDSPGSPTQTSSTDYLGIWLNSADGTYSIHDNTIYAIQADGLQIQRSTGTGSVYNNEIYNCGENSIDNKGSSNITYYNNHFYRSDYTGIHGSGTASMLQLIGDATGGNGSASIVIRDNIFGATDQYALRLSGLSGYNVSSPQVYRNKFGVAKRVFHITNYVTGAEIHHNWGVSWTEYLLYSENGAGTAFKFYFNSFYHSTGDIAESIYLTKSNSDDFSSNIIRVEDANAYIFKWTNAVGNGPIFSKPNMFYNSANAGDILSWEGTGYDNSEMAGWNTAASAADTYEDPTFTSTSDLTLVVGSPAIDDADLSALTLTTMDDHSLHPDSIWTFGAFDILTAAQSDHGANDELGAFVYPAGDPTPPDGNDFSGNGDVLGFWQFDNDTTDSDDTADLTNSGVTFGTTNVNEGTHYGVFVKAQDDYAYRTDANMPAGFPGKNGVGEVNLTAWAWFYADTTTSGMHIVGKKDDGTDGWYMQLDGNGNLEAVIDETATQVKSHASTAADDTWYFGAIRVQAADGEYKIDLYDTNCSVVGSQATGNFAATSEVSDNTDNFTIGANAAGDNLEFDGRIDGVGVAAAYMTDADILDICQNAYGDESTPPTFTVISSSHTDNSTVTSGRLNVQVTLSEAGYVSGNPETDYFTITPDTGNDVLCYYESGSSTTTLNFESDADIPPGTQDTVLEVASYTHGSMIITDAALNIMSDYSLPDNIDDNKTIGIKIPILNHVEYVSGAPTTEYKATGLTITAP